MRQQYSNQLAVPVSSPEKNKGHQFVTAYLNSKALCPWNSITVLPCVMSRPVELSCPVLLSCLVYCLALCYCLAPTTLDTIKDLSYALRSLMLLLKSIF